jgi:Ca2+-binding EF-hand superfamily protein
VLHHLYAAFSGSSNSGNSSTSSNSLKFSSLAGGLSVLCGGSRESKLRAAFSVFDSDGKGAVTVEELSALLASIFKVSCMLHKLHKSSAVSFKLATALTGLL